MSISTLWREATLTGELEGFLTRVGRIALEELAAERLLVRVLDRDHVATVGAVTRTGDAGAVVGRPPYPRVALSAPALGRATAWLEGGAAAWLEGGAAADDARATSSADREDGRAVGLPAALFAGITETAAVWSGVPLGATGMLLVGGAAAIEADHLRAIAEPIAAVLAAERARRELSQLREAAEADKAAALARLHIRDIGAAIVGADAGLREVMRQVEQVAPTDAPVLILGETGSGKEVVARAIHERSRHRRGPILRVNCGAIPPELVDSELFGHERGSFTGASAQRRGWFERADGGTLFLDEIGELPLAAQVRLLRVLQDGVFERVGGSRPLEVDVRIVAATHRDLGAMVRAGQFREDLWYRIDVFVIRLPPLRERTGDIAALAEHFAARAASRFGAAAPLRMTAGDLALLEAYDWPGNVRELAAVMERAAILGEGKRLDVPRALGVRSERPAVTTAPSAVREFPTLDDAIRAHIARALERCGGRIDGPRGAARLLAVHPNTLRSRMEKLGMRQRG